MLVRMCKIGSCKAHTYHGGACVIPQAVPKCFNKSVLLGRSLGRCTWGPRNKNGRNPPPRKPHHPGYLEMSLDHQKPGDTGSTSSSCGKAFPAVERKARRFHSHRQRTSLQQQEKVGDFMPWQRDLNTPKTIPGMPGTWQGGL